MIMTMVWIRLVVLATILKLSGGRRSTPQREKKMRSLLSPSDAKSAMTGEIEEYMIERKTTAKRYEKYSELEHLRRSLVSAHREAFKKGELTGGRTVQAKQVAADAFRFNRERSGRDAKGKGGMSVTLSLSTPPKDPCAPVKDRRTGKEVLPNGCDPPRGKCPGEPSDEDPEKFLIDGVFRKLKKDEVVLTCSGHGRALRSDSECVCSCDQGWGGGSPVRDCSLEYASIVKVQIDCIDMPDRYMMECASVASTVCNPYSLVWKFECQRTCRAVVGRSCESDDIARHCSHDPECPLMCFKMMRMSCDEQIKRYIEENEPAVAKETTGEQEEDSSPTMEEEDGNSVDCESKGESECVGECVWDPDTEECL
eukprot:g756.t1